MVSFHRFAETRVKPTISKSPCRGSCGIFACLHPSERYTELSLITSVLGGIAGGHAQSVAVSVPAGIAWILRGSRPSLARVRVHAQWKSPGAPLL